jgi:hypothetical protein
MNRNVKSDAARGGEHTEEMAKGEWCES